MQPPSSCNLTAPQPDQHMAELVSNEATGRLATPPRSHDGGDQAAGSSSASDTPPTRKTPGTVLVVDDMALNRLVLGHMVRKAGLEVVEASNGAECVAQVRNHPPGRFQCILMDLQMPVMDGWEAAQQVRAWEACGSHQSQPASDEAPSGDPPPTFPDPTDPPSDLASPPTVPIPGSVGQQSFLMTKPSDTGAFLLQDEQQDNSTTQDSPAELPQTQPLQQAPQQGQSTPGHPQPASAVYITDSRELDLTTGPAWPVSDIGLAIAANLAAASRSAILPGNHQSHAAAAAALFDVHSAPVLTQARIPIVACTAEVLGAPSQARLIAGGVESGVSASGAPITAQSHALSCGMDECVKKPLSFSELCTILDRYIPERQSRGSGRGDFQRAVTCDVLATREEPAVAADDTKGAYNRSFSATSDRLGVVGDSGVSHPLWQRGSLRPSTRPSPLRPVHTDEGLLVSEDGDDERDGPAARLTSPFPAPDLVEQLGLLDCITEEHILDMSCACLFDVAAMGAPPDRSRSGGLVATACDSTTAGRSGVHRQPGDEEMATWLLDST